MDLKERFDQALDGGPAHRPIEDRLAVGRRATRRRRTAVGASVLATVVVLGGVGWAAVPGPDHAVDGSVATSPPNTPTPRTVSESPAPPAPVQLFGYDLNTAKLETAAGLVIERQMENPVAREGVVSSAAVATYKGKRLWLMAAVLPGRSSWSDDKPAMANRTFEQWVHELTVLNADQMFTSGGYDPGWVTLSGDGVLTAHKGASILKQNSPARIDQAPAGVPSATATIEVDGARFCVVARTIPTDDTGPLYLPETENQGCGDAVPGVDYPGNPAS